jgi:hypothetical protein
MRALYCSAILVALISTSVPSSAQKAIGKCMRADCASMQAYCNESRSSGKTGTNCEVAVHSVLKPRSGSAPLRMVRSGRVLFSLSQDRNSLEEAATKAAPSFRMSDVGAKRSFVGTIKVLHKSALHASHRHRMAKSSCRMGIDRDLRDLAGRELVGALYFERGGPGLDLKSTGQRR